MKVRNFEPDFYEIHWREPKRIKPSRWATAAKMQDGSWFLCNETSREIKPTGALGKKIVKAVEAFISKKA
jgi:hypothetical protein